MTDTKGFTLIELLIVAAIIGILAAAAVLNFMNMHIKAAVAGVLGGRYVRFSCAPDLGMAFESCTTIPPMASLATEISTGGMHHNTL